MYLFYFLTHNNNKQYVSIFFNNGENQKTGIGRRHYSNTYWECSR